MLKAGFHTEGSFGCRVQDGGILEGFGNETDESLAGDFHRGIYIVVNEVYNRLKRGKLINVG